VEEPANRPTELVQARLTQKRQIARLDLLAGCLNGLLAADPHLEFVGRVGQSLEVVGDDAPGPPEAYLAPVAQARPRRVTRKGRLTLYYHPVPRVYSYLPPHTARGFAQVPFRDLLGPLHGLLVRDGVSGGIEHRLDVDAPREQAALVEIHRVGSHDLLVLDHPEGGQRQSVGRLMDVWLPVGEGGVGVLGRDSAGGVEIDPVRHRCSARQKEHHQGTAGNTAMAPHCTHTPFLGDRKSWRNALLRERGHDRPLLGGPRRRDRPTTGRAQFSLRLSRKRPRAMAHSKTIPP